MPFLPQHEKPSHAVFIGETEYATTENDTDKIRLYIYLASPHFDEQAFENTFADQVKENKTFINDAKQYLLQFD